MVKADPSRRECLLGELAQLMVKRTHAAQRLESIDARLRVLERELGKGKGHDP